MASDKYDVTVIGDVFCDIATTPIVAYPERDKQIGCEFMRGARFVMRAGHWNTEGLFTVNKELIESAKAAEGVYTGVDLGWSAYLGWTAGAKQTVFEFLPATDFLFVNEAEIEGLSANAEGGAKELLAKGCKNVIVHRGENGSAWIARDFVLNCPSSNVKPISPTGAGDVFNAGFIYAVLAGKQAEECLRFANACAALHISRRRQGNVFPTLEAVEMLCGNLCNLWLANQTL